MKSRFVSLIVGFVGCTLLITAPATGQSRYSWHNDQERTCPMVRDFAAFHACALENMGSFEPPRTPDGKPDFNGIWRPTRSAQDIEDIPEGKYGSFPASKSLLVAPPDGKFPYKPWAMKERFRNEKVFLSPTAVCLPVAQPRWSYSPVSVTGHRIIQQEDLIVFSMERLHTYRMIHMDDRPRLPEDLHLWQGDSRGHWDGNTLVIKTTNLNDLMWMDHIGTFMSPDVVTEERITYVDQDTLHYEQTVTDPNTFTQPWTISLAFLRQYPSNPVDTMDLEDTSVENCEEELIHMMNVGQVPFPGYEGIAPK